jgi:ADP-ribose pyrophosphatase YjhB (NUDIX family)
MPMSDYMRGLRSRVGSQVLEIPSVSVLCFDPDDRVLLVYHSEVRCWTTPGGAVEPFEVPSDAAVREMWEETGLEVELLSLLGVYGGPEFATTYTNGDRVAFAMTVFAAESRGGKLRPDGDETLEVRWFSKGELPSIETQRWVPEVLTQAWSNRTHAHYQPPTWRPPA